MKRIAIGLLQQETNVLNPVTTQREDFAIYGLVQGPAVIADYGDVGELAGMTVLPEILGEKVEWLGLMRGVAWHGGPLAAGLAAEFTEAMTAPLHDAAVDGVLLSLHGAHAGVDEPDVCGRILAAVRQLVGAEIPVVATLDLHANITAAMAQNADLLYGFHTFPHIDQVSCGERGARGLAQLLHSSARPAVSTWKIPMVVNSEGRATDRGIQRDLWRQIVASEERDEVASVGLYMVQPWFDVPLLGWTLYQAYWGAAPPFEAEAIAHACWEKRHYRDIDYVTPETLIERARKIAGGPVAVSEGHDATNSGAPGDSTHLLAAMVAEQIGAGGGLCFCVDPESVGRCRTAGVGAILSLEIGGKRDPYSEPLIATALVEALGELHFTLSGHGGHNLPVDMGRMARVRVRDTTIVLVEKTGPGSTPLLYQAAGCDPRAHKIVLAKSPEGFRQDYEPFSSGILYAAAPGAATPFIEEVGFKNVDRPLFPLDDLAAPAKAEWAGAIFTKPARG